MTATIYWNPGMILEDAKKLIIKDALNFYKTEEKAAKALNITLKEFNLILTKQLKDLEMREEMRERMRVREEEFVLKSRGIHRAVPV